MLIEGVDTRKHSWKLRPHTADGDNDNNNIIMTVSMVVKVENMVPTAVCHL